MVQTDRQSLDPELWQAIYFRTVDLAQQGARIVSAR
jgi:hypothetical protein